MPVIGGLSPHLRLQSDERLVALTRRGHHGAFEALVKRYQPRLLAFCRHILGSTEDAEDVLQEVLAAAYKAIRADDRPIAARPWLYRIARNRCLNHLRRPADAGQDSMDDYEREQGATTADAVHRREELREIVADVRELPETQRTALVLREMDSLSYDQIADAMETTVPSVKSLLVRARISLAEASEARRLACAEVRLELSQAAEGIARASAPVRRHVRSCPRCRSFKRDLRSTSRALGAVYPLGPLIALKQLGLAKLGGGGAGAAVGEGAAGGYAAAGGLLGGGAAGLASAGAGSAVTKAAAGLVAAAVIGAGAVGVPGGDGGRDAAGGPAQGEADGRADHQHDGRVDGAPAATWNGRQTMARAAHARPDAAVPAQNAARRTAADPPAAPGRASSETGPPPAAAPAESGTGRGPAEQGDREASRSGPGGSARERSQPVGDEAGPSVSPFGSGTLIGGREGGDQRASSPEHDRSGGSSERPTRDRDAREGGAAQTQRSSGSGDSPSGRAAAAG